MATIKLDLDRRLGTVDRRIFGGFVEHLGRCIYGGMYEKGSPLADEHGFRTDVLEAVPGARAADPALAGRQLRRGYHWIDGIGPKDKRPRSLELAWHSEESNRFGTDEFIEYCRVLGTEPYICVNMGSGTMDEAQAWVEYCNGTGNTEWAQPAPRRTVTPSPTASRYWGLGNEMYGALADRRAARRGLRQEGPRVRQGDEAGPIRRIELDRLRRERLDATGTGSCVEGLAAVRRLPQHPHLHRQRRTTTRTSSRRTRPSARCGSARPLIEQGALRAADRPPDPHRLRRVERVVPRARGRRRPRGALRPVGRARRRHLPERVRPPVPAVRMANLAQLVNVIAPIFTSPTGCSCRRSTIRCGCTPSTCETWRSTSTSTATPTTWSKYTVPGAGHTGSPT